MEINFRIFGFCKIAHGMSFEAIETYLHRNVYPSDTVGDKGKKANFSKGCQRFSMLHGELMNKNTRLVISCRERQHTIISNT